MQTLPHPTRTSFSFYISYSINFKSPQSHKFITRINIYNKITKNVRNDKNTRNDVKNIKDDIFMQKNDWDILKKGPADYACSVL